MAGIILVDPNAEQRAALEEKLGTEHDITALESDSSLAGVIARQLPDLILLGESVIAADAGSVLSYLTANPDTSHIPVMMIGPAASALPQGLAGLLVPDESTESYRT